MLTCPACRSTSPDGAKFCQICGTDLSNAARAPDDASPAAAGGPGITAGVPSAFGFDVGSAASGAPPPSDSLAPPAENPSSLPATSSSYSSAAPADNSARRAAPGMATASLVLGILGLLLILPAAILALIFGYLARTEIRKFALEGEGLAKAGIVMGWIGTVVAPIVFMALFVWGFDKARDLAIKQGEEQVLAQLTVINDALDRYHKKCPDPGYPNYLGELGGFEENCEESALLPDEAIYPKNPTYVIEYEPLDEDENEIYEGYAIHARPVMLGFTGRRQFFTDQTGAIRHATGNPASAESEVVPASEILPGTLPDKSVSVTTQVDRDGRTVSALNVDEDAALATLRSYHTALEKFAQQFPSDGYPLDHMQVTRENPPHGTILDSTTLPYTGYSYSYEVEDRRPGPRRFDAYVIYAEPRGGDKATARHFLMDETGTIRWARGERPSAKSLPVK